MLTPAELEISARENGPETLSRLLAAFKLELDVDKSASQVISEKSSSPSTSPRAFAIDSALLHFEEHLGVCHDECVCVMLFTDTYPPERSQTPLYFEVLCRLLYLHKPLLLTTFVDLVAEQITRSAGAMAQAVKPQRLRQYTVQGKTLQREYCYAR